uniref:Leucine-rich repeat LGI family, member 2b n=1 Tax=Electrophorus electricus TaxID=8005 RepID=A0AAY5ESH6_ELEEL
MCQCHCWVCLHVSASLLGLIACVSVTAGFVYMCLSLLVFQAKRIFKCPSGCTCTSDSIICVGSSFIPRAVPIFKKKQTERCLFCDRKTLLNLSLANNNMKTLPKGLFGDLHSLIELDLRGNLFQCDCESKWLMLWLKRSNATVSDVYCAGPADLKGLLMKDVPDKHAKCISTDFVSHQIINTQSMSADIFFYKEDIYAALPVPDSDSCIIMEWDHIETKFRPFDNITGSIQSTTY